MGRPMAKHLAENNLDITVYNRTMSKSEDFVAQHGGKLASTPSAAAEGCDIVFCCVGNDDDVTEVTIGEQGAFMSMPEGSSFVDHTTTSATLAKELYSKAKGLSIGFIDAPVSGGQSGAENGTLTVMCGGEQKHFNNVNKTIAYYAKTCLLIGESGSGQLTKMVNQICIAGLLQALSEAVNFGQKANLNMDKVIEVIAGGAAQSWQMDNRAKTMINQEFNFGFAVELMRKDLGICLNTASSIGASLPITAIVDQLYAKIIENGGSKLDTSSLISLLQKQNNKLNDKS